MPSALSCRRGLVAILAVALVATGGLAYAAIPDAGGVIHTCYTKSSGAWRVIDTDAGQACKSNEAALALYSKSAADLAFLDKPEADGLYLGKTVKAADSDKLDGKDSSDFLGATATAADSSKLGGFPSQAYVLGGGVLMDEIRSIADNGSFEFGCCSPIDPSPEIRFKLACNTAASSTVVASSAESFRWWWDGTFGDAIPVSGGYQATFTIGTGAESHRLRAVMLDANATTTLDLDTSKQASCLFAWTVRRSAFENPGP
ncbi:MAG TPA: hypothetical protein VHI53_06060 [Gaiellaceae bacterium]|jgi:hypothetical protein|nr:hypothetical protein [Gaiellaceae bacterium]